MGSSSAGAGRHVACDANSHSFLREIPQCWITGQAAGVAAALCADAQVAPRSLDVGRVQAELLAQGAYLSPSIEAAVTSARGPSPTDAARRAS